MNTRRTYTLMVRPIIEGPWDYPTNPMAERTIQDAEYTFPAAGTYTLTLAVYSAAEGYNADLQHVQKDHYRGRTEACG